ncbi:ROK family transcriptional regulator [Nitratireductor sp. GCM10026969]|uniref:ROK family transcriptional regulator n=1 Tax=Nitratireductor sp. GCM10026969 TaxID=3252645 RepID=UPI00361D384A
MEKADLQNLGEILSPIALGQASSRSDLQLVTGLSRVTVTQRLNLLLDAGLVIETTGTIPSGGRPSRMLALNPKSGFMLVGDIGESFVHLAAVDLDRIVIDESTLTYSTTMPPQHVLAMICEEFKRLASAASGNGVALGACLSLPTPVDYERGRVVGPSVLPGWDDLNIIEELQRELGVPSLVENDVNLMTIYEYRQNYGEIDDLFFIKAGTGIGSGIIADGRLFRGAQGAAGDIGHIQFIDEKAPLCRCGKPGCVEARAGGWAIARDLTAVGLEAENARDVLKHLRAGKPEAIMLIRNAGRTIGEVISDVVSILNPRVIVVGGTLAQAGELLVSGIRELVYQRCLPLATRELEIVVSAQFAERALFGAAYLLFENIFSGPGHLDFIARTCRPRDA